MFENNGIWIIIILAVVVLAALTVFLINRSFIKKFREDQKNRADNVLTLAKENAQEIEITARDNALKIKQNAESELARRRTEMDREDERILKRRSDLDSRMERLEQREVNINKRQSVVDKRVNEIDRQHSKMLEELQRVSQMTTEEAKTGTVDACRNRNP